MVREWEVHSYQLNIDEGDSAVHLLVDGKTRPEPKNIEKAVLVDGGKTYGGECIMNFRKILSRKGSGYQQLETKPFTNFDAIVITHWDSDHREGIVAALGKDIESNAADAVIEYKIEDQDQFDEIVRKLVIKSNLTQYHGDKGEPSTVLYAPYWNAADSETRKRFDKPQKTHPDDWVEIIAMDGRAFLGIKVQVKACSTETKLKGTIPVALLKYKWEDLLGVDFFGGARVLAPADAINASVVSQRLKSINYSKPVMFCVAADSWVCDPANMKDREDNWQWTKGSDDLTDIRLTKKVPSFRCDEQGRGMARDDSLYPRGGDISTQSVLGTTTGNNQASIACMIIWPHENVDISLYIAGDLGDKMEEHILRWSAAPSAMDPNTRITPVVDCVKLSHHGSKFSTPILMLLLWKPHWIMASNGMRSQFNHVSWETAYLCLTYAYWYNAVHHRPSFHPPLMATNYPVYLTKHILLDDDEVKYINCGAIDSLTKSVGEQWREVINKMWKAVGLITDTCADKPKIPLNLLDMDFSGSHEKEAKLLICKYLGDWWEKYSFVPVKSYGGLDSFDDGMSKAAAQTIRFVSIKQGSTSYNVGTSWFGTSYLDIELSWGEEISPASIMAPIREKSRIANVAPVAVNDKTQRNLESNRLARKNVTGNLMDSATAQLLDSAPVDHLHTQGGVGKWGQGSDSPDESTRKNLILTSNKRKASSRSFATGPSLCYFMATDAIETQGPVKKQKPVPDGNLDLFLSALATGAIVLPDELEDKAKDVQVDGSDELLQWLLSIFGDFDDPAFTLQAKASTANISRFSFTTRLNKATSKALSFSDPTLNSTMITFSTDNDTEAFSGASNPPPSWLGPPADGTADPDIDIIGPAFMLLMGLSSKSGIEQATIKGKEIIDLFEIQLPTALDFLPALTNFNVDTRAGTKCGLWFFPDAVYKTVFRLQFKPEDGDPASALASSLADTIKNITSVVQIDVGKAGIMAKKTWRRSQAPSQEASADVESSLAIYAPVTFHRQPQATKHLQPKLDSFTVDTALEIARNQTNFILTFDASQGGTSFSDLLEFFVSLLPGNPELPSLAEYLPGIDTILLRRIKYVVPTHGLKVVTVDLQATWASMTLQCTLTYRFGQGGGAEFAGSLFMDNQLSQLGQRFSFVAYMPDHESWNSLPIIPGSTGSKQLGDLGDIYSSLTKAEGSEKQLVNPPTSLQLLGLNFYINSQDMHFNAIVISPKAPEDSVPQIRLTSATLDVLFNYTKPGPKLKRLAFYSNFVLQPRNSDDYATLSAALEYAQSKWTLTGSAGQLSGGLLYSLFDSGCDDEMVELLKHIILDVNIVYNYDSSGKGSDFCVSGGLYLGPVTLDYQYNYKGKTGGQVEPVWTLTAALSVDEGNGSLVDIIAAICGTDTSNLLPSWLKKVTIKASADKTLTSLRVTDLGTSIFFVLRVKLTDGASIAFYRLSQKKMTRNNPSDDKPPVTKTALVLTVDSLPTVENIPLIGSLPQPFDELDFVWVSSNEDEPSGFTRSDIQNIEQGRANSDPVLRYQDNVKKDQQKDTDILLASGYHFIVVASQKVALDYVFGQKKGEKNPSSTQDMETGATSTATSPIDKTFGPVKLFGLGLGFDLKTNTLSIVIDGTLTVGPLALTLLGFGVSFSFDGKDLRNLASIKPSFDLSGLAASFQQDPVLLQGLFERGVTADGDYFFQGAATVGITPYLFQAVGYYGKARDPKPATRSLFAADEPFDTFFTYCQLNGPIMTIFGFAELTGLRGGFGYNSTIAFPNTQNLLSFPFITPPDESDPSKALFQFFQGGWFTAQRDSHWIAAGVKVLAFEMLEVQTILTVEFGASLKFGLFGFATAEMPKRVEKKFVRVQLGIAATVDFDAGVMKIDGQLTPTSFILDPSCHVTGGFAMYSWFDSRDPTLDGDWVFTVGGYHKSFKVPTQYPVPPRLAITWNFDESINITGESYFAINSKVCMGGGRLHLVMTVGPLYAYFDAYADFLINYKPFHFQADGGILVGVHFTLDLWLVTIQINVDLAARLYLQGPPVNGTVHIDFYVFGFDVDFGERQVVSQSQLSLEEFYQLVLQADNQPKASNFLTHERQVARDNEAEVDDDPDQALCPHIFSCTSGLMPSNNTKSSPSDMIWSVRGAVFAFDISCKFALTGAEVITKSLDEHGTDAKHPVDNPASDTIYAKPMWISSAFFQSQLEVTIANDVPAVEELGDDPKPLNPEWDSNTGILTSVPTALWGAYDAAEDPSNGNNDIATLLDGTKGGTAKLLTGVSIHAPTPRRSDDTIAAFNVQEAMGKVAGLSSFPCTQDAQKNWQALPKTANPYADVRMRWNKPFLGTDAATQATAAWCNYATFQWDPATLSGKRPDDLIADLETQYTESPRLSSDDAPSLIGSADLRETSLSNLFIVH